MSRSEQPSVPARRSHLSRRVASLGVALLAIVALSGCAQTVNLDPAADANNPLCAAVSVRLPDTVAEAPQRDTTAQATGAWGEPADVVLHCGVTPPGPTTDPCYTLNGVDWIEDDSDKANEIYVYTTYGRDPAVEVVVNIDPKGGVSSSTALIDLSSAVEVIPQTSACTNLGDVVPGAAPTTG